MNNKQHILIIGAGLCGSLLALRMAQRAYKITLVEKRPDLRKSKQDAGRSINLALSNRGLRGLRLAGVEEAAKKLCIPMNGRMIHDVHGNNFLSPYSGRKNEYINSISRPGLNMLLLDAAEKMPNVTIIFNHGCEHVDLEIVSATFKNYANEEILKVSADIIFGTDGAGSAVRQSMSKNQSFNLSQEWLSHGYKEISIPAAEDGGHRTEKHALHIWPRGEDMLIALPNLDGSFTVTLFLPYTNSDYCFQNLTTPEMVHEYFKKEYPDAVAMIPNLTEEFFGNPTGPLGTIKCSPWHSDGKVLLMGDAAHAIVPFYGQGMNASFEDVVVFDEILEKHTIENSGKMDWKSIFEEYEKNRKKDTDAIADLAVDNFHEMKEHTADPLFQQKRKLETAFEAEFLEDYYSKYSLVTFKESIPYSEAMKRGRAQDKAILDLFAKGKINDEMDLGIKLDLVKKETQAILHDDQVAFG